MTQITKILPVLLCGGSGSRLWPVSRQLYPKQLLPLGTEAPLVIETARRMEGDQFLPPLIICNEEHRFLIASLFQQYDLDHNGIILEPFGRNTAPAAAVAALFAQLHLSPAPDLIMLLPSDHLIRNRDAFHDTVSQGAQAAKAGHLVTFGITPTHPETGYGYIKQGQSLAHMQDCFRVAQFVEKPNFSTAETYIQQGGYSWNSGIFLFDPDVFCAEAGHLCPDVLETAKISLEKSSRDLDFIRLDKETFAAAPDISIDYAIMEKTDRAALVTARFDWSDIGSWHALWEQGQKDSLNNITKGEVLTLETTGSYIESASGVLTAVIGLEDVVVVVTDDAILVSDRSQSQKVKEIVSQLKNSGRAEYYAHKTVYRPWGSYKTLALGNRFQVKEICVLPGASLSLQYHHHRAEHWVVVEGTAEVTRGGETFLMAENQSTYIPIGDHHRLTNPGKTPLKLIEVQSGSYLGEDDIVRLEDIYKRV